MDPFLLAGFRFGFVSTCWLNPFPVEFDLLELHVWFLVLLAVCRFGFFSSGWLNPSPLVLDLFELQVWLLFYLLASGLVTFRLAG